MSGGLEWVPVRSRPDLLAAPVLAALEGPAAPIAESLLVAEIDPHLADTTAFCERYGVGLEESANCIVLGARRVGQAWPAACLVLATTRADVNGVARRRLGASRISFAPVAEAVELTGMEFGGITPIGLPAGWRVLVDPRVTARPSIVAGSGLRRSKLRLPGGLVAELPGVEVVAGLAVPR